MVGRAAVSVEDFNSSPALPDAGSTWTPEMLEINLASPTAMVQGPRMVLRFHNADDRRAIFEFLSSR